MKTVTLPCGILLAGWWWLAGGGTHAEAQNAGAKLWEFRAGSRMSSSPALGTDGSLYFGADRFLYALNANGTLRWQFTAKDLIGSSPTVDADGSVYFGCLDHCVYGLTPKGVRKFVYPTEGPIWSSPALDASGALYIGSDDGCLHALQTDGQLKWSFSTDGFVRSSPAIGADGTVYFGSWDHKLYAVSPEGQLKWTFPTRHYVYASPALGPDGTIYIGSIDDWLYALDPNGKVKWSVATGNHIYSSPALGEDGTVFVGAWDNRLYAFDSEGKAKWSFTTGGLVHSSPAVGDDGSVLFGSDENKLFCLNADGSKRWTFTTGGIVRSSPVISPDGTVYFGSEDGRVYAIKSGVRPAVSAWPMFRGDARHWGKARLVIVKQPQPQRVIVGCPTRFEVTVSGPGPFAYQWRLNGVNLGDGTNSVLIRTNVQSAQAGEYTVVVSNPVESRVSAPVGLVVILPPMIATQPQPLTVVDGAFASFRVLADSDAPISYQWILNNTNLPGATNATLSLVEAHPVNRGQYQVVLQNSAGVVTSAIAPLTVVIPPPIMTQPRALLVPLGGDAALAVAADSLSPMQYQWKLNNTNVPGATASNLALARVQPAQAGIYTVVISNMAGAVTSAAAPLTVVSPPVITRMPTNQIAPVGGKIGWQVEAVSAAPLSYQWLLNGSNLAGSNGSQLVLDKVGFSQSGAYSVILSNLAGMITSAPALFVVMNPPSITQPPKSRTNAAFGDVLFSVTAAGSAPLEYAWFFQGNPIAGANGPQLRLAPLQLTQAGNYSVVVSNAVGAITSAPARLVIPESRSLWQWLKGKG